MGKRSLSKRELEEQRKREEEKAAAHVCFLVSILYILFLLSLLLQVFQEFVETFQEAPLNGNSKVWVKAGTYDAGARSKYYNSSRLLFSHFIVLKSLYITILEEDTKDKGKLYKPTSRLAPSQELLTSAERAQAYAKLLSSDKKPERLGKKKQTAKSNLESFMEELRQIQEEREERHKYKGVVRNPIDSDLDLFMKGGDIGSFDNGDPTTTNLYLGNLNPKVNNLQCSCII